MHLPRESLHTRRSEEGFARLVSRYLRAVVREDRCANGDTSSICEKPVAWQRIAFPVTLTIGLVVAFTCIGVLVWLHLRRTKRDKAEMMNDPLELLDYGITRPGAKKSAQHSDGSSYNPSRNSLQSVVDEPVRPSENPFQSPDDNRAGGRNLTSSTYREKA